MKYIWLLIFSIAANASVYDFPIESPMLVSAYTDVLNGISALFANNTYLEALHFSFLMGTFFVFSVSLLKSKTEDVSSDDHGRGVISSTTKYLIGGMIILTMALYRNDSNQSQLLIHANYVDNGGYCQYNTTSTESLVNFPEILATVFSASRIAGHTVSDEVKTIYQNISADSAVISSLQDKALSGNVAMQAEVAGMSTFSWDDIDHSVLEAVIVDNNTSFPGVTNSQGIHLFFPELIKQCILASALRNTSYVDNALFTLKNTENIIMTLDSLNNDKKLKIFNTKKLSDISISPQNSAIKYPYVTTVGDVPNDVSFQNKVFILDSKVDTCSNVYKRIVKPSLTTFSEEDILCSSKIAKNYFNPVSLFLSTNDSGYATISGAKEIAIQIASANLLKKSMGDSLILSQIEYASDKTIVEKGLESVSSGIYLSHMIPYLQMSIRLLLYALFPFTLIIILLPGGLSVAVNYLKTILWIELWTPTAGVLTYFLTYANLTSLGEVAASGGFSLNNSGQYFTDSLMLAGASGYLYASVPAITLLIISSSSKMMSGFLSGLASSFSKNMDSLNIQDDIRNLNKFNSSGEQSMSKFNNKISALEGLSAGSRINAFGTNKGDWANKGIGTAVNDMETSAVGKASDSAGLSKVNQALENKSIQDTSETLSQFNKNADYKTIGTAIGTGDLAESEKNLIMDQNVNLRTMNKLQGSAEEMEKIQKTMVSTGVNGSSLDNRLEASKGFGTTEGIEKINEEWSNQFTSLKALGQESNPQSRKQMEDFITNKMGLNITDFKEVDINGKKVMFAETDDGQIFRASPNAGWLRTTRQIEGGIEKAINDEINSPLIGIAVGAKFQQAFVPGDIQKMAHANANEAIISMYTYKDLNKSQAENLGIKKRDEMLGSLSAWNSINSGQFNDLLNARGVVLDKNSPFVSIIASSSHNETINDAINSELNMQTNINADYNIHDQATASTHAIISDISKTEEINSRVGAENYGNLKGVNDAFSTAIQANTNQQLSPYIDTIINSEAFSTLSEATKNNVYIQGLGGGSIKTASDIYADALFAKQLVEWKGLLPDIDFNMNKLNANKEKLKKIREKELKNKKLKKELFKAKKEFAKRHGLKIDSDDFDRVFMNQSESNRKLMKAQAKLNRSVVKDLKSILGDGIDKKDIKKLQKELGSALFNPKNFVKNAISFGAKGLIVGMAIDYAAEKVATSTDSDSILHGVGSTILESSANLGNTILAIFYAVTGNKDKLDSIINNDMSSTHNFIDAELTNLSLKDRFISQSMIKSEDERIITISDNKHLQYYVYDEEFKTMSLLGTRDAYTGKLVNNDLFDISKSHDFELLKEMKDSKIIYDNDRSKDFTFIVGLNNILSKNDSSLSYQIQFKKIERYEENGVNVDIYKNRVRNDLKRKVAKLYQNTYGNESNQLNHLSRQIGDVIKNSFSNEEDIKKIVLSADDES